MIFKCNKTTAIRQYSYISSYFQSDSPSASGFNQLGIYLLVCLGFVVAAVLEFALIILIKRRASLKINLKDKEVRKVKEMRNHKKICPASKNTDQEATKPKFYVPPIHVIDVVSFWVHFSSFLIFNIIYWHNNLDLII